MNEVIGPIYYVLANDSDPSCQGSWTLLTNVHTL